MKILIVDDHQLFREGLTLVLQKIRGNVEILQASDYESAVDSLRESSDLDVMMLDLHLAKEDGFSVLSYAREHYKSLPVIVLTGSKTAADMRRAIDGGALGFIPKESSGELMLKAVQLVLAGGIYLPAEMHSVVNEARDRSGIVFTPRQKDVLKMLIEGHANKNIADSLGITEATIKMHLSSIFKALGVSNRTQAVLEAQKMSRDL
ncbi:response regulator transcription factor [Congregibacter variabilis]|uniref:Response regulator transcription factor n=1 Tax=Congregibacter variabilis TaxID=3081200 RepID=A0ABZ0I6P3_9GAMM|nr:response regulator transcription factor [Congregibacter sp. IMCC43200]